MTRSEDVRVASDLGVDAIGLIFAARSPRRLDLDRAISLRELAQPLTRVVGLVMDNPAGEVAAIVERIRPHVLQFHGSEDDAFCARFGVPFLKALPMRGVAANDVPAMLARYPSAAGFVLDGHLPGAAGGSGQRFDWDLIARQQLGRPWLLAGGLDASNVGSAVRLVQPMGVDVSSGIESVPGFKDHAKMSAFVEAVRRADEENQNQSTRTENDQR